MTYFFQLSSSLVHFSHPKQSPTEREKKVSSCHAGDSFTSSHHPRNAIASPPAATAAAISSDGSVAGEEEEANFLISDLLSSLSVPRISVSRARRREKELSWSIDGGSRRDFRAPPADGLRRDRRQWPLPRPTPAASTAPLDAGICCSPPRRDPPNILPAEIRRAPSATHAAGLLRDPRRRDPPRLLPAGHRAPLRPSPWTRAPLLASLLPFTTRYVVCV
ncbi:hypothetical protein GUJ93_ZPchr0155g7014 [Zizania palustris]|uniref:Uncharacterized protein n=1 Tax=Zizania palustris TaxID=103762 RepID=A0A8J5VEQ5_ZIZPA|nr:hypothetical protein GUJ93_ZPchr0155g7014 [Zizania palustris]